jgi:hypothetical protein
MFDKAFASAESEAHEHESRTDMLFWTNGDPAEPPVLLPELVISRKWVMTHPWDGT